MRHPAAHAQTAQELTDALVESGHNVTLADVLDCLALAGLSLTRSPDEAAQAYSEYILKSVESVA